MIKTYHKHSIGKLNMRSFSRMFIANFKKRKILLFSLISLLIVLPISLIIFNNKSTVEAAWMNDQWGYRQTVAVTGTASPQVDFQVNFVLNTSALISAGKMQANCNDLRVTDPNGKILPLWIETNGLKACNQTTTKIWVKAPTVATSGITLYVYYGNPSASPISNGSNVFIFFDDFNSTNINTTKWAVTGNMLSISGGRLRAERANGTGTLFATSTFARPFILDMDYYPTQYPGGWEGGYHGSLRFGTYDTSNGSEHTWTPHGGGGNSYNGLCDDGGCYHGQYVNPLRTGNVQYNISMQIKSNIAGPQGVMTYTNQADDGAGSQANDTVYTGATTGNDPLKIGVADYGGNTSDDFEWDNWRVRKFDSSTPIASVSNEQKSPAPVAYWKFDEGYGTNTNNSTSVTGINGTIAGATWATEDKCISGKCLYFDGTADNVAVLSSVSLETQFTFSHWIRTLSSAGQMYTIGNAGGGNGYRYGISGGRVAFLVGNASVYTESTCGTTTVNDNKWHLITGVFDNSAGNFKCYIDGRFEASVNVVNFSGMQTAAPGIGAPPCCTDTSGFIDDVKIYSYARTAAQIKSDFASKGSGSVKGTSVQMGTNPKNNDAFSNGLVGYWKMDEAATPSVDSSGNGNNGTWANSPAAIAGVFGNGIDIPGVGGSGIGPVVNVADSDSIDIGYTNSMTSAFWIKNDSGVCAAIIKKTSMWEIYRCSSSLVVRFDGASPTDYSSATALTNGQWYHVIVTRNYQTGKTILYLNGQKDTEWTFPVGAPTTNGGLGIGAYNGGAWAIDGKLDDVRLYNREFSPKEVRDLYNWAPGPVGYWNMDEGTGINANDLSGNGITGTLQSSPTWTTGKFGKGLNFNGTSQYITTSSNPLTYFTASKGYTVESWVKLDQYQPNPGCCGSRIAYTNSGDGGFDWRIWNNGVVNFYRPTTWCAAGSSVTVPLNQWTHLAATYNNQQVYVYMNGIQVASTNSCNFLDSTAGIVFNYPGGSHGLYGSMDDSKVYNYARSPKQIVEDMNAGHPIGGSPVGSQVGYWKFDEGYGTVANNSGSGGTALNGTFGTTTAAPTWSNNGKFGKALMFDGLSGANGDKVTLSTSTALNITGSVTVDAWIKPSTTTTSNSKWIINKHYTSSPWSDYSLVQSNANIVFYARVTTGSTSVTASNVLTPNVWHHVVGVYDQTAGKLNIYINGVLKNTANGSGALQTSNDTLRIGIWSGSTDENFSGLIDEVKIYNAALTADEIKLDYNRGSSMVLGTMSDTSGLSGGSIASSSAGAAYCIPGDTATCNPPVGEWKMDEKTGTSAYDTSGNGYVGTLDQPTWKSAGECKQGACVEFDGVNDYINTSYAAGDKSTWTMEAWIYDTAPTTRYRSIIQINSAADDALYIYPNTNYLGFWPCGTGTNTTAISQNIWHHVVASYNSSSGFVYYLDGKQVGTGNTCADATDWDYIKLGGLSTGDSERWKGKMDNVKIYDYVRTPAQIAYDYNRGAPVGHWKMDECQGITANDSSGNGNAGTITIGATIPQSSAGTCTDGLATSAWYNGRTGKYNASLNFDGTDDRIGIPASTIFDVQNLTISAWVYSSNFNQNGFIFEKGSVNTQYSFFFESTYMVFRTYNSVGTGNSFTATNTNLGIVNNNWYHLVATYDGAKKRIYVNGIEKASTPYTETLRTGLGTAEGIGSFGTGNGYNFNGQIDDVRIYNYALTPVQIKTLYNGGAAIQFAPATGSP